MTTVPFVISRDREATILLLDTVKDALFAAGSHVSAERRAFQEALELHLAEQLWPPAPQAQP